MMKTQPTFAIRIAKIISVIGHPFVLLSLTVLISAASSAPLGRALTIGGVTALLTVLPLVFIIRRKVRAGKWSDHDVSDASERRNFYPIALSVTALSLVVFYLLGFPRGLLVGMLISLALLLAAMFINRFSKISLHLIFAVYFAVSLCAVDYRIGGAFLLLAAAVGWSRVKLGRHTPAQVLSGAALGAAAGLILLKVSVFF
jgi:membrane-associated phospholipid phosphatase